MALMKQETFNICLLLVALLLAACRQDNDTSDELLRQQQLNAQLFLTLPQNPDEGIVKIAAENWTGRTVCTTLSPPLSKTTIMRHGNMH
ncbi:MAG: hypothetical protein LBL90_09500 [Prevotellaceae bacterium]|nr:hypothetical protein [Prevotellaceae bacterium]